MEVNVCSLYDEKKGENFSYYLFTNQNFHLSYNIPSFLVKLTTS